ncbi:MAG: 23S rRNA (guanosine(2251)-2'-O)-methyltransferase RlmB [Nitrospinae bacterium]|nr:23S rRNA (guanosine(2251)-2'-O)-methyltransferase RlmB [Nitrospinota bacterium]
MATEIVFGKHPVMEVLRAGKRRVETIFHVPESAQRLKDVLDFAQKKGIPLKTAGNHQLDRRTQGAVHQGILAVVEPIPLHELDFFIDLVKSKTTTPVVVAMDSIEDPHNFGAVLRSAETLGVAGAIFPKDRSCDINSTVVKSSAGATEHMDFCRVTNISETLRRLRKEGFYAVAAEADGEVSLPDFEPQFPLVVVIGSEGRGVRPLVRKNCDTAVKIPILGKLDSLNVSSASAIIFYEISKRLSR